MKTVIQNLLVATVIAISLQTHAQGTLVYDQQSASGPMSPMGNGNMDGLYIQTGPLTQSFIPSLSSIGFVQFEFQDVPNNGTSGATVYVKLWSGSPNINSAVLLGSTTSTYMPNGFVNNNLGVAGVSTFTFSTPITVIPGQTYYLQPVVLSGDNPWAIETLIDTYPKGELFASGFRFDTSIDLWFREGTVAVPEPTILGLVGLAGTIIVARKRRLTFCVAIDSSSCVKCRQD